MTSTIEHGVFEPHLPDDISVRRWFVLYGTGLLAAVVPLAMLIHHQGWTWSAWVHQTADTFAATSTTIKLLGFAVYVSLCTTFLPLPTGWIVAGVATRQAAIGPDVWTTVVLVAFVGAFGSTIANLNDYHILTWMLRHHRIAKLRHTRTYKAAAKWFTQAPFLLLVVFNIMPIPVDVVRMLATSHRYPRLPFAAANFIGRLVRYAVIAFVTYWWDLGWAAVVALVVLAVVILLGRLVPLTYRKLLGSSSNQPL